jgi:putative redox protein
MVKIDMVYEGGLHCSLKHGPSGQVITTDAPVDNHGKGEAFSPTDLVGAAMGSCMLTLMGIYAERHHIDMKGTTLVILKEMSKDTPRRIAKLDVTINLPAGIPHPHRSALEHAALTCPVHHSLHPDIELPSKFNYPD